MARWTHTAWLLAPALAAACAGNPDKQTLARLHSVEPDVTEVKVENSLEKAMVGYRKFLAEAPESALTPEAMRRLADLELEKEYGLLGDGKIQERPAPEAAAAEVKPAKPTRAAAAKAGATQASFAQRGAAERRPSESDQEFERRATRAEGGLG
ncbi:MAG: hypothetical protein ACREI7_07200, partial [Myxococcota bacterium]